MATGPGPTATRPAARRISTSDIANRNPVPDRIRDDRIFPALWRGSFLASVPRLGFAPELGRETGAEITAMPCSIGVAGRRPRAVFYPPSHFYNLHDGSLGYAVTVSLMDSSQDLSPAWAPPRR